MSSYKLHYLVLNEFINRYEPAWQWSRGVQAGTDQESRIVPAHAEEPSLSKSLRGVRATSLGLRRDCWSSLRSCKRTSTPKWPFGQHAFLPFLWPLSSWSSSVLVERPLSSSHQRTPWPKKNYVSMTQPFFCFSFETNNNSFLDLSKMEVQTKKATLYTVSSCTIWSYVRVINDWLRLIDWSCFRLHSQRTIL
jgi:hypothetical protein